MLNQVVLVGRLTRDIEVEEGENGKFATLHLAIPRAYKNAEGIYETDFVEVIVKDSCATNTAEYCKKGDLIGVKGRIQTTKEGNKIFTQIMGEKVTFLSNHKED